jgi:hypothetical protein
VLYTGPNEWNRLIAKIGLLTLTAGLLEAAITAMHCKATGKSDAEFKGRQRLNGPQRDGLKKAVKSLDWPDNKKAELMTRLSDIAALDMRRNAFIHLAAGIVSNNSLHGVPAGSVIDLRTFGIGVTTEGTIGLVATKIDLDEIDRLIDDINHARVGLGPYMELVDKIRHPAKSSLELIERLENRKPLS